MQKLYNVHGVILPCFGMGTNFHEPVSQNLYIVRTDLCYYEKSNCYTSRL